MNTITFKNIDKRFLPGIAAFGERYNFNTGENGLSITVKESDGNYFSVVRQNNEATIEIAKPVHLFRALGLIVENFSDESFNIKQKDLFLNNGLMYDGSQASSLLTVNSCKNLLLMLAAMGLNFFMLYTENTFDLEDEPYWGYMRPRYTKEDFKEIDDFAYSLGIEVIPCIQTLGHLSEAIKWKPYSDFSDSPSTLLVGDKRTYALCEKIIKTMDECFRTKKIHIGMDEAWGLGQGSYLAKNGFRSKTDIMFEHLNKIVDITKKYNMEPMMWGDMFVRMCSENETDYLEGNFFEFPNDIKQRIPKDIQIIYWDYYNRKEYYEKWMPEYKKICSNLVFSGCSRNVRTFASHHTRTYLTSYDALMACKKFDIQNVFVTVWGDDHRESSPFAVLPGIQLFAEHQYNADISEEAVAKRFEFCTSVSYKAVTDISLFDQIQEINGNNYCVQSPSKTLLWQNILLGLFDAGLGNHKLSSHYSNLAKTMKEYNAKFPRYASMYEFYYNLAEVLSIKADIGKKITTAYLANDKPTLKCIAENDLPELEKHMMSLRNAHQADFYNTYHPIGWEILDIRYGGAVMGIKTAQKRINDYLNNRINKIAELEEPRLLYNGEKGLGSSMNYNRICSASNL